MLLASCIFPEKKREEVRDLKSFCLSYQDGETDKVVLSGILLVELQSNTGE